MAWFWIAIAVSVVAVLLRPARVVVRIAGGRAELVRGRLPGTVLEDLGVVASLSPEAAGRVELRGRGDALTIRTPGLAEGPAQRVRNTLLIRRRDV